MARASSADFNGAATHESRRRAWFSCGRQLLATSMGPRLMSRGGAAAEAAAEAAATSMGPRLMSRGGVLGDEFAGTRETSMGPRLMSRGGRRQRACRTRPTHFNGAATHESRRRASSHLRRSRRPHFNGAATHESRRQAEAADRSAAGSTSMGPRLMSRGGGVRDVVWYFWLILQWGRDS